MVRLYTFMPSKPEVILGTLPMLALTTAMLLWSSAFISLKYLLTYLHPTQIVFFRMLLASCCFLLSFKQLKAFQYQKGDWIWLMIMGIAEPCLYFLFETSALKYTTAGQAGMITATLPLLVSIAAYFILKEKISRFQILGFFVAIAGCILLSVCAEAEEQASNPLLGNGLEFMAMICGTIYSIAIRRLSSRYSAWVLTSMQAFIGTLFFGPLALSHELPTQLGIQQWGSLIYLATLVTIGAYWLYNWSVSQVEVSLAGAYINLIPVFTLILAFVLLNERINSIQGFACVIVFAGVVLSQIQPKKQQNIMVVS